MDFFIEYGCVLLTLLITLGAQSYIDRTYKKTEKINSIKKITGKDVANLILKKNDLTNVKVEETVGILSDHYDPKNKTVRLSPAIYNETSLASISVAAHECGHAIQDKKGYFFLRFRNGLIPFVNFASYAGYFAIMIGIFTVSLNLIWFGILMELVILFFQLITLPVEFNASKRALLQLEELKLLDTTEKKSVEEMLRAAAMTYVASVVTAILQVLRLVLIFSNDKEE